MRSGLVMADSREEQQREALALLRADTHNNEAWGDLIDALLPYGVAVALRVLGQTYGGDAEREAKDLAHMAFTQLYMRVQSHKRDNLLRSPGGFRAYLAAIIRNL